MYADFVSLLGEEQVKVQEKMALHTTFRIGGCAAYYLTPKTIGDLLLVLDYCKDKGVDYEIIGNGSNLLVTDEPLEKVIICLCGTKDREQCDRNRLQGLQSFVHMDLQDIRTVTQEEISSLVKEEKQEEGKTYVCAGAGAMLSKLAAFAADKSLEGLAFAGGIPGTVGGAVVMNAGAYGGEIKDCIAGAVVCKPDGKTAFLDREELQLGYRHSIIGEKQYIVLAAIFALSSGQGDDIWKKMREYNASRREKQPLEYASAGSTFKRPEGYFAGKLIQDAGLKGYRVGDIMVSDKHSGFVVNVGNGTAEQVMEVVSHVQQEVLRQFGVLLEMEVKTLGLEEMIKEGMVRT